MIKKYLSAFVIATTISGCTSLNYQKSIDTEPAFSGVHCDIKEIVTTKKGGTEYQLINLISDKVAAPESCTAENFTERASLRYIFVSSKKGATSTSAQFAYQRDKGKFGQLEHWLDLKEKHKTLDKFELIRFAQTLPIPKDKPVNKSDLGLAFWSKIESNSEKNTQEFLQDFEFGIKKTTIDASGTKTELCQVDGLTWTSCS